MWGIGAGLAAVAWSGPEDDAASPARHGAIAGALAGIGALLGLLLGTVLQFGVLGGQAMASEFAAGLSSELGYDVTPSEYESTLQWAGALGIACCLGFFNVAIMASAGAGGAALYASKSGTNDGSQAV